MGPSRRAPSITSSGGHVVWPCMVCSGGARHAIINTGDDGRGKFNLSGGALSPPWKNHPTTLWIQEPWLSLPALQLVWPQLTPTSALIFPAADLGVTEASIGEDLRLTVENSTWLTHWAGAVQTTKKRRVGHRPQAGKGQYRGTQTMSLRGRNDCCNG